MPYLFCPFQPAPHADNGGCAILPSGWRHPRRRLDSSVMILGRKGNVTLTDNGVPLEIRPNRLVLLPAEHLHDGAAPIAAPASYYWLHFRLPGPPSLLSAEEVAPILSNQIVTRLRLNEAALIPMELDLGDADRIALLFRELLNEQERPSYTKWQFQLLFQNLLIRITEETINSYHPPDTLSAGSSLVYEAVGTINAQLTDPNLSVKSIAGYLNHNPDYIGRQFRSVMGMSVGNYILQQRLKLAEQLLQETHQPVQQIASQTGFASLRHFLRQFRKERGMTPSELRRRYQAMHINIR
ncbi:AraC family transcriptional regulator [Hydrogenispora ethanolica]|uniref:AraC family transcriptional regulator n=1 Tax=Hydrogenispora ethanolica TaxID=1082276 RepID=A0A4R1RTY5_HYDET|nr:AraC family transcriptional regulator [Hydrogenispora ethanolica]TCL70013.1 AraC family transcriptional regulator [Hydrogenispora ethanolica]